MSALSPPIQHENERRGYVLDKKTRWDCRFPSSLKSDPNFSGDQLGDGLVKMFMKDRPRPPSHIGFAAVPALAVTLEERKAEGDNSLMRLCRGRKPLGLNRVEPLVNEAGEQFVFVSEVRVKRRPADIGAVENLLDSEGIVVLFVKKGNESLSQES